RIPDDLPGAVIRDVAPAVDVMEGGAPRDQAFRGSQEVSGIAALAQRVHGRMFQEQQHVRDHVWWIGPLRVDQSLLDAALEVPCRLVLHPAEVTDDYFSRGTHASEARFDSH